MLDVNDNIPVFREMKKGSVLENEPPGVPVMQVRAIDADGTSAHNQVPLIHSFPPSPPFFLSFHYSSSSEPRIFFDFCFFIFFLGYVRVGQL